MTPQPSRRSGKALKSCPDTCHARGHFFEAVSSCLCDHQINRSLADHCPNQR